MYMYNSTLFMDFFKKKKKLCPFFFFFNLAHVLYELSRKYRCISSCLLSPAFSHTIYEHTVKQTKGLLHVVIICV